MEAANSKTVLVTGGTGYLGGWCVAELLRRGYRVRTTVRDLSREAGVRAAVEPEAGVEPDLTVLVADLRSDEGWEDAVAGCDYVLHVASPFPPVQPKNPDELIVPAREGTLRVLRAALAAGVGRVVVTSSVAAVRGGAAPSDTPLDEHSWTDPGNEALSPYVRSKAAAERAACELVDAEGARERLATVQPGAILGPALGDASSFSLELVERLLKGMPGTPRIGFSVVDVRDVADLHIRAMLAPEAGGERFIAVNEFLWMSEVAAILRERLGTDAAKVPKRGVPDLIVRALGLFDPSVRAFTNDLGKKVALSSEKARMKLDWQPRPVEETVAECARSLLERSAA
ncbi:MAG: NAD-dependent epimerase/dehydratase family protein [Solirubrobacterales bacterium]